MTNAEKARIEQLVSTMEECAKDAMISSFSSPGVEGVQFNQGQHAAFRYAASLIGDLLGPTKKNSNQ